VIYGTFRREKQWKIAFAGMATVASIAILSAAFVITSFTPPAPIVIPYDVSTGFAVRNAAVEAISLSEDDAIISASIYRYIVDRESYNQLDNDIRIKRAMDMSESAALTGLRRLWNSAGSNYPPEIYGNRATIEVNVTGIIRITNDRAQVRMTKRLITPDGVNEGAFTSVLKFAFEPSEEKTLEAVWQNPLGFKIQDYSITADKKGSLSP
jgi:type IV secretion system protein VirB8